MSRVTYTSSELANLAQEPESELSPWERRAVKRWRRTGGDIAINQTPDSEPTRKPAPPALVEPDEPDIVAMLAVPAKPTDVPVSPRKPAGVGEPATGLVRFVDSLPEDALVRHSTPPKWRFEAIELRTRPRTWAHLCQADTRKQATTWACSIRTGKLAAFHPAGLFDATMRTNPDGTHHVYARYTGEPS